MNAMIEIASNYIIVQFRSIKNKDSKDAVCRCIDVASTV